MKFHFFVCRPPCCCYLNCRRKQVYFVQNRKLCQSCVSMLFFPSVSHKRMSITFSTLYASYGKFNYEDKCSEKKIPKTLKCLREVIVVVSSRRKERRKICSSDVDDDNYYCYCFLSCAIPFRGFSTQIIIIIEIHNN